MLPTNEMSDNSPPRPGGLAGALRIAAQLVKVEHHIQHDIEPHQHHKAQQVVAGETPEDVTIKGIHGPRVLYRLRGA